ncbi:dTDP-glucose 4,6 dehydratase, NAD(P)-binding [Candidatus Sulfobium mesophilum]|uniref:dTDP-glucose 4,6-dehydratase n=1 Tax=Candidatus Sulfobium mesophilum TaxID=2016548 RepID=A0A2U3QJ33_9BACT|nr:dTDP-glucose 4,6 dehydratase, NAD(P)-binding [Candidatus Sulfobium mesophilum]
MKVLITGGAGFIGSNFIRHFISAHPGYEVVNLDKLTYAGNFENLTDIEALSNYTFVRGDVCDRQLIDSLKFDAIIHFAAESHVDRSIIDASPFLQTNVIGTQVLLEAARKRGCRMLHVSTDEVYGSIETGLFTEESPVMPNSPYAASKASSDLLARAFHETYGVDVVITRCSNNYGPYQFPEKLMPLVIANAIGSKAVPVYGDGMNIRDWIYVIDHCRAVDIVFHKGRSGDVYNIGGKNEQRNIDIVKKLLVEVARKGGMPEERLLDLILFVKDRPGHDRRYAIDPSKMERELCWGPETGFDDGIAKTVEWYLANRGWWQRIISGEYQSYYEMQYGKRAGS